MHNMNKELILKHLKETFLYPNVATEKNQGFNYNFNFQFPYLSILFPPPFTKQPMFHYLFSPPLPAIVTCVFRVTKGFCLKRLYLSHLCVWNSCTPRAHSWSLEIGSFSAFWIILSLCHRSGQKEGTIIQVICVSTDITELWQWTRTEGEKKSKWRCHVKDVRPKAEKAGLKNTQVGKYKGQQSRTQLSIRNNCSQDLNAHSNLLVPDTGIQWQQIQTKTALCG